MNNTEAFQAFNYLVGSELPQALLVAGEKDGALTIKVITSHKTLSVLFENPISQLDVVRLAINTIHTLKTMPWKNIRDHL